LPAAPESLAELYTSDPSEFVATRDRLVKALRAAGDTEGARDLAKRRKPTLAAHGVNRLAHEHGDALDAYLDLGTAMREAQIGAARDQKAREELRSIERDRREQLNALLAHAGAERDDVERALTTALSDPELAATVRAGTLEKVPDAPSGFDAFAGTLGEGPAPAQRESKRRRDESKRVDAALEAARGDVTAAEAAVRTARDTLHAAERRAQDATKRLERLEQERARLDED
jgi:hypothetical protein